MCMDLPMNPVRHASAYARRCHSLSCTQCAEITDKLGLHALRQRTWYIQSTCATSGEGAGRIDRSIDRQRLSRSVRCSNRPTRPLLPAARVSTAHAHAVSMSHTGLYEGLDWLSNAINKAKK